MNVWKCDICGKQTVMNPKTEPILKQVGMKKVPIINTETGEIIIEKDEDGNPQIKFKEEPILVQVNQKMRRQNLANGTVETIDFPTFKILEEPAILIRLKVGYENVQTDFCNSCFEEHVKPDIKKIFDKLMDIAEEAGKKGN